MGLVPFSVSATYATDLMAQALPKESQDEQRDAIFAMVKTPADTADAKPRGFAALERHHGALDWSDWRDLLMQESI